MASQKARRPPSVDCSSAATAARANKRRFVNLLQQLGAADSPDASDKNATFCDILEVL
jgi:hypothetical protein